MTAETRQAAKAVEAELDLLGLQLGAFAPHGMDSSRVGDYLFAEEQRAALARLKAAWLQVALLVDETHREYEAMRSHLIALGRPDLAGETNDA